MPYLNVRVSLPESAEIAEKIVSVLMRHSGEALLGPIAPASYIVIHDLGADSWGYQGRTQEYRFVRSQAL